MTSFKSLVGHTKAASGIAGFIKAVIAVNRRVLPPFAGHKVPNPVFARTAHALYPILRGVVRDPGETIRAGASAMGFGGINCHVALESGDAPADALAPSTDERVLMASGQETELFPLATSSVPELLRRVQELVVVAAEMSVAELTDLAAELAASLEPDAPVRAAIVAGTPDELAERLEQLEALLSESPPAEGEVAASPGRDVLVGNALRGVRVGFLFPGQGSQQLEMARVLVERHEWARELAARADVWLVEAGAEPVGERIYRPLDRALNRAQIEEWSAELAETEVAQPAICLGSLLWLRYLDRLGVRPGAVAGHSLGELTAFHAAGAFDEQALLTLAAVRGRAMAAPSKEAGAMAALGCSREQAEELVGRVSGYVVVANVNSPVQVVVSGDLAAVEEVTALAEAEGLKARILPVSNAFHSARVENAAEQLRAHAPVPERLPDIETLLVTGMGGREVAAGTELREHFAKQVLAQVDFVSVAKTIAERCDVLVEVGPGGVLSGLVRATVGADGTPCVPVASEPGADRDLNVVLANLFVRGAEIRWDELYAGRLVRPFVPASELCFIENPLELPLDVPDATPSAALPPVEGSALADAAGLTGAELAGYLARRGRFLGQVISADLGTPAAEPGPPPPSGQEARPAPAGSAIEGRLVELAAELTGFPVETIPLEARLLDDLNLESIKAGELVSRAADEYGAGELELGPLANAALTEVAEAIRAAIPSGAGETPAASTVLLEVVANHTGFPADTLTPDLRLLDDLHLDSIKAAEVVLETAGQLGIADEAVPDPSTFANASLAELAAALEQISGGRRGAPRAPAVTAADPAFQNRPSWVREFVVEWVDTPIADGAEDLTASKACVVFEAGDEDLAAAVAEALGCSGAEVVTARFAEAAEQALCDDETVTHVVALLPRRPDKGGASDVSLRQAIERLRTPVATAPSGGRTLVYVQFARAPLPEIEQGCAAAFAAGVHHERPDVRVRVIDAAPDVEPAALAERVLAEIATQDAYTAVSYDGGLTRQVPTPRVLEPAEYVPRPISWSAADVIVATGGAKGITAECALALARSTGARFALVGSSPPPADADGGEIAQTLARFEREGLACRYYQCDIGDPEAVGSLVETVRAELGEITGVIHGAGANTPRRVEQVTADAAAAEAAPKVLGALNLGRALAERPPKLFVGFSSIIGVTGMPGNSWYGFANEALDLTLRRFGEEHSQTAVLSIAFSIWGEVGMGVRMGSAEQLGKMGVATIPTDEGIQRFLRLVERDPGDSRVVVAARLRGLDTWHPAAAPPPAANRFLEDVLHVEPGVEVVSRARLTLERDTYLQDHVYKGSHLFPTVFGLEAMAQAVALAAGRSELGALRIDDVRLERAVVVDPGQGTEIEIRAGVLEREGSGAERRVRAAIGTAQTGFAADHFSATFVLGLEADAPVESVDLPLEALDIRPEEDLYGRLLFQGPQFQRLRRVYSLDSRACVFVAEERETEEPFELGDPFFREALLHGAQLVVPQSVCLPVDLGSLEIFSGSDSLPASRVVLVVNEGRVDEYESARVLAVDERGRVLQRLERYRLRILERREDNPTAEAIADPGERDGDLLRRELVARSRRMAVRPPEPALAYLGDMHSLSADERHELEQPLFREALERIFENGGDGA
jgi:malonyl CoA-acyl carrier protein transacylase/NADP-dependent 3-hydroxy acid dehydrogenase YdfG/3-hydroxymyristoyl/3-hydroxydecanoyl-(acyl carrier protein) dehydratase